KSEAQQHLQLFASTQTFCVLKVGDAILSEHLDELGSQLAFLYELGLLPILGHGGGPQLNSRLARERNPSIFGGHTLSALPARFLEENLSLTDKLDQLGVSTRLSVASSWQTISTRRNRATLLFFCCLFYYCSLTRLQNIVLRPVIYVMASLAETEDGQALNVNADSAATELARALKPQLLKVRLVRWRWKKISQINRDVEDEHLMSQPWRRYGTRPKLVESRDRPFHEALVLTSFTQTIFRRSFLQVLFGRWYAHPTRRFDTTGILLVRMSGSQSGQGSSSQQPKGLDAEARVDRLLEFIRVIHSPLIMMRVYKPKAIIACLSIAKFGWLSKLAENIFSVAKTNDPPLYWRVSEEDENLADESSKHDGGVLFYYGSDFDSGAMISFSRILSPLNTRYEG
ncbi:unnamed protein product, partial [Clonostachys chloroleuca]